MSNVNGLYLCSQDEGNGIVNPTVEGEIASSINIQYNTKYNIIFICHINIVTIYLQCPIACSTI